jgi:hypothetical protein
MKLEQQVPSLELSKQLKELGVKQDGYFAWQNIVGDEKGGLEQVSYFVADRPVYNAKRMEEIYSAFTVAELGNLLWSKASPDEILKAYGYVFNVSGTTVISPEGVTQCMENPALGAKMLIYLLENKLITL